MSHTPVPDVQILRWIDTATPASLVAGIEAIFFATAATTSFADPSARAAFRERWLGRYLDVDPEHVWLAWEPQAGVAGYLVGCLDDPARTARFSDIGYFASLADVTARYPAHIHINLDARWRGAGLGSRLISVFCASARQSGAPGVHVVTGAHMRNVGFYQRNGFHQAARQSWNGKDIVMLGRDLG